MNRRRIIDIGLTFFLLIAGLAGAAAWLAIGGFYAVLSGLFGGVGGWAWAIGYFAGAGAAIVLAWPFRGRRQVAIVAALISVVAGLIVGHIAPYNAGHIQQVLDELPSPAHGRLAATEVSNNCFGDCPTVRRFYVVPDGASAVDEYARVFSASTPGN